MWSRHFPLHFIVLAVLMAQTLSSHAQSDRSVGQGTEGPGTVRPAHASGCQNNSLDYLLDLLVDKLRGIAIPNWRSMWKNLQYLGAFTTMPLTYLACTRSNIDCSNATTPDRVDDNDKAFFDSTSARLASLASGSGCASPLTSSGARLRDPLWQCELDPMQFPPVLCRAACLSTGQEKCVVKLRSHNGKAIIHFLQCTQNEWRLKSERRSLHLSTVCVCECRKAACR